MSKEDDKKVSPHYKSLYLGFKKSIANEENIERILYLQRKVKMAMKTAKELSKDEIITKNELYFAHVYIFIFHFRLLDLCCNKSKDIENENAFSTKPKLIDFKKVCVHFRLTKEQTAEIERAFATPTKPIDRSFSKGILIGHDAITSIFGKKQLIKKLKVLIDELEFYFPNAPFQFRISSEFLNYVARTKYFTSKAMEKHLDKKIKNKATIVKHIQKLKGDSTLTKNKQAMTIVKTSSRNQVDLLSIADKKAGIMITVNSILLTILIPLFASYIFDFSTYLVPVVILVVTCGVTIFLATLATRPSIAKKEENTDRMLKGQKSIFYFKNFANLTKEEFVEDVQKLLTRETAFEKSVFTDLFDVGIDLDRKYKRLRWCYTVFGTGIILTMISFMFCIIYFNS